MQSRKSRRLPFAFDGIPDGATGEVVAEIVNDVLRHTNKVDHYERAFKDLDNAINLFFLSYSELERSSLNCARLWVGVMRLRTLMTNSITCLSDQDRFLTFEFQDVRLSELSQCVRPARAWVAKAIQYISMHRKERAPFSKEVWRFQRKAFLAKHANDLFLKMEACAREWTNFLLASYEIEKGEGENRRELKPLTSKAFRTHLLVEDRKARFALAMQEPSSNIGLHNERYFKVLRHMLKNADTDAMIGKDDFLLLRVQLNLVRDILDLTHSKHILVNEKDQKNFKKKSPWAAAVKENHFEKLIQDVTEFLEDRLDPQILKADETIWPHQQGIQAIGPYSLISVSRFEMILEFYETDHEYGLRQGAENIRYMAPFHGIKAKMSPPYPIVFDPITKGALNIHSKATHVRFMFGLKTERFLEDNLSPELAKDLRKCHRQADEESALHCLALHGGFAYYDKLGRLLDIKGLTIGDDLFFDGPYRIPNNKGFQRLEEVGIPLCKLTFADLIDQGAVRFGWVSGRYANLMNVDENSPHLVGNFSAKEDAFRCFAYDYGDRPLDNIMTFDERFWVGDASRRNYFQLVTFDHIARKKEKNNNTPIIAVLEYIVAKHRMDWRPNVAYRKGIIDYYPMDIHTLSMRNMSTSLKRLQANGEDSFEKDHEESIDYLSIDLNVLSSGESV